MNDESLGIYLNNHLSGSSPELKLAIIAASALPGSEGKKFLREFIDHLTEERDIMTRMLKTIGRPPAKLRKIGNWAVEKVAVKRLADFTGADEGLSLLVELEGVLIGTYARSTFWEILDTCIGDDERFSFVNFRLLRQRTLEQWKELEQLVIDAAPRAFSSAFSK